ncbi:MAG: DUF445 domain-containing protein [Candidatus Nanopelagicales bacterium]
MSVTLAPGDVPGTLSLSDDDRRSRLRRMRMVAGGFLLGAAAVFLVCLRLQASGVDDPWVGYVLAASEAAMVGGLADWFAVTALFRHPLGIPIPHTAIIPRRKEELGKGLASFVSVNFLGEDVVRSKLSSTDAARRAGEWLAEPEHADRVAAEVASVARGALSVVGDEHVHDLVQTALLPRLAQVEVAPHLGRLIERVVNEQGHRELVDILAGHAVTWVADNRERVVSIILRQAPSWSPRFVDDAVGSRIHAELLRFVVSVRDNPEHPVRQAIDRSLLGLADGLQHDERLQARVQGAWVDWVTGDGGREAAARLWTPLRRSLDEMVAEDHGPLRRRVAEGVETFGRRLQHDPVLRERIDGWVADAAVHVVSRYRDEIVSTISDTVDRWDGEETARRIELYAGRDLQFIRINGTVVGALVGVLIHAVAVLAG